MEDVKQPERELPQNTILFCKKPWQIPSMILSFLVLLTFAWAGFILVNHMEMDYFDNTYELSAPEFLFRDMAATNMQEVAQAVAPGVVGVGASAVNTPPVASGVLVSSNGHVITVLHPVQGVSDIAVYVKTSMGVTKYRAEITKALPSHDLALLKILSPDRFMYFTLADTASMSQNLGVLGIGFNAMGNVISKEGQVIPANSTLTVGSNQISHLLGTDAVYTWEQSGGPIVNGAGELVGIGVAIAGDNQQVQGYAIPAHVLAADFGDVITLKMKTGQATTAPTAPSLVPAAMPNAQPGAMAWPNSVAGQPAAPTGSSPWWTRARTQVAQQQPRMGMNIAAPNGPQVSQVPGPRGMVQGQPPMPFQQMQQAQAVPGPMSMGMFDSEHLGRTRIAGFTVGDVVSLVLLAVLVGVTSGMMTMGGGVLQVAGMMIIFGYGMHLIRPVAYLTNLFILGASVRRNSKNGMIMWSTVKSVAPWACVGTVAGYFIGNALGDRSMGVLLGIFAALMTLRGIQELLNKEQEEVIVRTDGGEEAVIEGDEELEGIIGDDDGASQPAHEVVVEQAAKAFLGLPPGLISGMLGISGGVIAVPMQRAFTGASLHNAIANSSVVVFWASLTGAIVAFAHGVPTGLIDVKAPLVISLIMIPGAYVGGLIGARLMKVLPIQVLRGIYTAIMGLIAVKMLFIQ